MTQNRPIKLRLPRQDADTFEHFTLDPVVALAWSNRLPQAQAQRASQQLREVLDNLNRIPLPAQQRFAILEALYASVQVALSSLASRYLNQPLALPEEPLQLAELAATLQDLTASGYTLAAVHTLREPSEITGISPARLVCESLLRAIDLTGQTMLLHYQLYQAVPDQSWRQLHQLYALAEDQGLENLPVALPGHAEASIGQCYTQTLILGCAKPNQLRQADLEKLFQALQHWSARAHIRPRDSGRGLFVFDLAGEQAPVYRALYKGTLGTSCRALDTDSLVNHLEDQIEEARLKDKVLLELGDGLTLPTNIADHLVNALGAMSMRNFARVKSDKKIWLSVGLSSSHYYAAGNKTLERILGTTGAEADDAVPANPFATDEAGQRPLLTTAQRYPVHWVSVVDSSPGGYCLEWHDDLHRDAHTGDLACVREGAQGNWSVALIRWVNHSRAGRTRIGIELLSPKVTPYGALPLQNTDEDARPTRVLLVPEIRLAGQPHTLITPPVGFREYQKVSLLRAGELLHVQLQRQIAVTGSVAQFDFRYIKLMEEVVAEDKGGQIGATYNSVWTRI